MPTESRTGKLKYEDVATVGDRIRAYDFRDRTDCYIEGPVQEIVDADKHPHYAAYFIKVDTDVWCGVTRTGHGRSGDVFHIPMEVAIFDWDGRVVNLTTGSK